MNLTIKKLLLFFSLCLICTIINQSDLDISINSVVNVNIISNNFVKWSLLFLKKRQSTRTKTKTKAKTNTRTKAKKLKQNEHKN